MASPPGPAHESRLMHGALEMCVLALLDVEPLHAYGLVQRLHECGLTNAGYGTIYPLVTRLRKQGLLDQRVEPGEGGPAKNVLLANDVGRATLAAWSAQWQQTTNAVTNVMALHATSTKGSTHVL